MQTVFRSDQKGQLVIRRNELRSLLAEREDEQSRGTYNPFKRKSSKDLSENIIECRKEINKIKRNLKNESF